GVRGRHFTWVSVCPEMEIGLGTPRETLRLVGDPGAPRLVEPRTGADRTEQMNAYAQRRARDLARAGLSGYVLKRASPSCGMERVRVYTAGRRPGRLGRGLFARGLLYPPRPCRWRRRPAPTTPPGATASSPVCSRTGGSPPWPPPIRAPPTSRPFTPPTRSCSCPTVPRTMPGSAASSPPPRARPGRAG